MIQRDTWVGAHLREALAILDEMEVPAAARVRHSLILDEVTDEIREGDHGLVVVGAKPVDGWMRFLLNDVSQQSIGCTNRPVLVVRTVPAADNRS